MISFVLSHSQNLLTTTGAPLSIVIHLYYRSLTVQDGPLGNGWSHSFETRLTVNLDSSVTYRSGDGEWRLYTLWKPRRAGMGPAAADCSSLP